MAGDWIAMRHDLGDDPAALAIAAACGLPRQHVVGGLHAVWCWFDRHTTDGRMTFPPCNADVTQPALPADGSAVFIDELAGAPGFADAMKKVGWLHVAEGQVCIPHFDRFNAQSAKARVLTARRVARHRERSCNARSNAPSVTAALPQNRTEQNSTAAAAGPPAAADAAAADGAEELVALLVAQDVGHAVALAETERLVQELGAAAAGQLVRAALELAEGRPKDKRPGFMVTMLRTRPPDLLKRVKLGQRQDEQTRQRRAEAADLAAVRRTVAAIPAELYDELAATAAGRMRCASTPRPEYEFSLCKADRDMLPPRHAGELARVWQERQSLPARRDAGTGGGQAAGTAGSGQVLEIPVPTDAASAPATKNAAVA